MLQRHWINTKENANNSISLLTWNTLANSLAEGFSNVQDPTLLSWDYRKDRQIAILLENDYDIICLQEIDTYDTNVYPVLKEYGYDSTFCTKYNDLNDKICIFWKKEKFNKVHEVKVRYSNHSQVALAVIFSMKTEPTKKFCVATTHLKAKPGFEKIRSDQAVLLMNLLQSIKDDHNCSVILAGDMNDHPESEVIKGFKSKYISAYDSSFCKFTTWKSRNGIEVKRVIDYIFHDSSIEISSLLSLPKDEECPTMLPAPYYPSDHLAIGCRFYLK